MEKDTGPLQLQSTFMSDVLQSMGSDNLSPENNNNVLNVVDNEEKNDLISENKKTISKNVEKSELQKSLKSNEFQEKMFNYPTELLERKLISEDETNNGMESVPNCEKPHENYIQSTFNESSNSSSDEEVLQTRFTVENKTMIYGDEQSSNHSFEEIYEDNISEIKTSPIIIQVINSDENNHISDIAKLNSEIKRAEIFSHEDITNIDMTGGKSLTVETDSNIEIESNCMQNSIENYVLNCNNKMGRNENQQQKSIESVIEMDNINLFAPHFQESNDISVDDLLDDFLNGSFDINLYQLERPSRNKEKNTVSERLQPSKSKLQTNTEQKKRENARGNKHSSFNTTKKVIQNDLNSSENKFFNNLADSKVKSIKRKKQQRPPKVAKKAKTTTMANRINNQNANVMPGKSKKTNTKLSSRLESTLSNAKQQKEVNSKIFNNNKNIIINNAKNENVKQNKTKMNTFCKEVNINDTISNGLVCSSPTRNPRNRRNSSLIASKMIKEIEMFENSDNCEAILLDSDVNLNFDDELMITSSNAQKHTGMFQPKKISYQYQVENKIENDKFWYRNSTEVNSSDSLKSFSDKRENSVTTSRSKHNKIDADTFDECQRSSGVLELDNAEFANNNLGSNTNFYDTFLQTNYLYTNPLVSKKKEDKGGFKNNENEKNKRSDIKKNATDKKDLQKNNVQSVITCTGAVTRSRKKTWNMLEKELLGETDDKMHSNNICKTVLLKKEKLVRKENIKDTDVYTVSNRSMMQTFNKSTKGTGYNMQYKIQNTESKYLETKSNNTCSLNRESDGIVSSKSKSINIVEKTIAAMNRCTAEFMESCVNVTENQQKLNTVQFDDTDIHEETQIHSNVTFVANENEQCYRNETVSLLKKSKSRKKNKILREKKNISKMANNFSSGNSDYPDSTDVENLEKNKFVIQSSLLKNNAQTSLRNENQAIFPSSGENENPWQKLIKTLNLEQINGRDKCQKNMFNNEVNVRKQIKTSLVPIIALNRCATPLTNQHEKNLDKEEINKQNKINHINEKGNLKLIPYTETKFSENCTSTPNKINLADSCTLNLERSRKKMQVTQTQNVKKSPKFKFQLVKNNGLQFEKLSSATNSSEEEFVQSNQNNVKYLKSGKNSKNNSKSREKYVKYLKNVFSTENNIMAMANDHEAVHCVKEQNKDKENFVMHQRTEKRKLILEDEDDVFSLSSSDSEMDNEKNQGSGLLCELFDENE